MGPGSAEQTGRESLGRRVRDRLEVLPQRVLFAIALLLPAALEAQLSPLVLTEPWEPAPHWAETFDDIVLLRREDTRRFNEDIDTFYWNSFGRIKFAKDEADPHYGIVSYKVLTLDSGSDNPVLDGQLNDIGIGSGVRVELAGDLRLDLFGGGGTANDGHFSQARSWYGVGSIGISSPVAWKTSLHFGVFYDGNRVLWPDIPLPYLLWGTELGEECKLTLGIPETRIRIQPAAPLELALRYTFPVSLDVSGEFKITEYLRLVGFYNRVLEGFWQGPGNRRRLGILRGERLFHELDRIGGGLRLVTKWIDASLLAGLAFNRRFRTGWDLRDLTTYREVDPAWFVALRLQGTFGW